MRFGRRAPHAAKQCGDHDILLGLRQLVEGRSRLTTLQKHCAGIVVGIEKPNGGIAIPEAQSLDLLRTFHVRHPELQYCGCSIDARRRRHPRAADVGAIKRGTEPERPAALQIPHHLRQATEPGRALRGPAAVERETLGNGDRHLFILSPICDPEKLSTHSSFDVHLIDGTYELFRHFYALPSARDRDGREVAAVRGVLTSVLGMIKAGATHLAVATDQVIESFRNDLWPGYKTGAGIDPDLWARSE